MPAGQHNHFVIQPMTFEFRHYIAREFGQEREIVLRINDERLPRPARELVEILINAVKITEGWYHEELTLPVSEKKWWQFWK